jgi:RNA polymerase sigma-70 factor (ECF subfamily)
MNALAQDQSGPRDWGSPRRPAKGAHQSAFHNAHAGRMMLASDDSRTEALRLSGYVTAIAQRADREAFAALFEHFAPRVKSYMMRLGSAAEAAEELAQETLLSVWRKAAAFDPAKAAASTWIFTIARNLRIDALRRIRPLDALDDPAAQPEAPAAPDAAVAAVQDEARIALAIGALPGEQAEVIRLSFFSDKPHSEIAEQLGLPLGTVKSRLRLAMTRLRAQLADLA